MFSFRFPGFPLSNFSFVGVGGGPGVFIRGTLINHFGLLASEFLPSLDRDVDETGLKFDRVSMRDPVALPRSVANTAAERLVTEVVRNVVCSSIGIEKSRLAFEVEMFV